MTLFGKEDLARRGLWHENLDVPFVVKVGDDRSGVRVHVVLGNLVAPGKIQNR